MVWFSFVWFGLESRLGDGGIAPSLGGLSLDVRTVPFTSTTAHEPIG